MLKNSPLTQGSIFRHTIRAKIVHLRMKAGFRFVSDKSPLVDVGAKVGGTIQRLYRSTKFEPRPENRILVQSIVLFQRSKYTAFFSSKINFGKGTSDIGNGFPCLSYQKIRKKNKTKEKHLYAHSFVVCACATKKFVVNLCSLYQNDIFSKALAKTPCTGIANGTTLNKKKLLNKLHMVPLCKKRATHVMSKSPNKAKMHFTRRYKRCAQNVNTNKVEALAVYH